MPEPNSKDILGELGTLNEDSSKGTTRAILKLDGSQYVWLVSRELAGRITSADIEIMAQNFKLTMRRIAAQEGNDA
jgi:hypothetical protein